uniref:NOC3p domain-containing protein n=1 Tax=Angiostrongylus cantonensis TaxID=6313 RepID=A0A158P734_ANGCA
MNLLFRLFVAILCPIVGDSVGVVNLTPAALQCLADKMPIGSLSRPQPSMRQLRMPGGEQMYVREDVDLDVPSLTQPPQMRIPLKRHIRVHWIRAGSDEEPQPEKKVKKALQGSGVTFSVLPAALRKRVVLPNEIVSPSLSFRRAAQGLPKKEQILVKPSFLEPLSVCSRWFPYPWFIWFIIASIPIPLQEQQVYLKEIVEACVGQDDKKRQQALQSLERDTGIQIRCNIVHRCLSMLIYVVRMMRAVAANKSVKDHGAKDTCRRSFRAVKKIFDDPSSSYSMIYGTITTLLEFATPLELIRLHPRIVSLLEKTRSAAVTSVDQQERIEANKLHTALTKHETCLRRLIKQAAHASKKDHSSVIAIKADGTYKNERVLTGPQGVLVQVKGQTAPVLNFCANNYLGLSSHPDVGVFGTLQSALTTVVFFKFFSFGALNQLR